MRVRFRSRSAPLWQGENFYHLDMIANGQGQHISNGKILTAAFDPSAIDPGMALAEQLLCQAAALEEAQIIERAVDPHYFTSLASSAKGLPG